MSLFLARFFVYAAFAIAPPAGAEPISDTKTLMLCSLFVASVAGLYILTRKRPSAAAALPESAVPDEPGQDNP